MERKFYFGTALWTVGMAGMYLQQYMQQLRRHPSMLQYNFLLCKKSICNVIFEENADVYHEICVVYTKNTLWGVLYLYAQRWQSKPNIHNYSKLPKKDNKFEKTNGLNSSNIKIFTQTYIAKGINKNPYCHVYFCK